jgi:hypothetical protein
MIVSVNVGFLYMAILQFVWVLLMVMSRKFIWLFSSHCCEFEFWVYCVEVFQYVLHV